MDPSSPARKVVVVGAGPVGCLAAVSLANMGWQVDIYEARPDMCLPDSKAAAQQRSINLAISSRGIAALQAIDPAAASRFLESVIPMRGRMIHDPRGNTHSQLYDPNGQCINSIDRALLNEGLLEEALAAPNVRIFFQHKVLGIDFDRRIISVNDVASSKDTQITFHLCVGADGAYSVVRRQMMRVERMNYQQEYVPHDYLELKMLPGKDDAGNPTFLLEPNYLHIWPRHSFMLIALPNKDMSFTCTLFAPVVEFKRLDSDAAIVAWFKTHFPDALALIGEEALLRSFKLNPQSPLMTVKARPYHYKDRAILLGDAAHSMVPFFGQGLNCGLEDVRVLTILLKEAGVNSADGAADFEKVDQTLAGALARYTETRHADLLAIVDLAMDNYIEMRHAVTTPSYLFRKALDGILYSLSSQQRITLASLGSLLSRVPFPAGDPGGWIPLYTMVTFRPDISYATAKEKAARQGRILTTAGVLGSVLLGVTGVGLTWMALWGRTRR